MCTRNALNGWIETRQSRLSNHFMFCPRVGSPLMMARPWWDIARRAHRILTWPSLAAHCTLHMLVTTSNLQLHSSQIGWLRSCRITCNPSPSNSAGVCTHADAWERRWEREIEGQWRLTSKASWYNTLANKWNIAAARGDSCECEAAWHWAALDGMCQSPDEANYHHLHLHTIITHQKGHVPLCQAADIMPCFQLCKNILYTYILMASECIVHGICICMERQSAIQVAYTYRGQKKTKGDREREILSLVARGKRSLHMCARPRLPLAPVDCVTCVHQGNLLVTFPLPRHALMHTTSRQGM